MSNFLKAKRVEEWSADEVQDWFRQNKPFAEFASKFKGFDGKSLASLTENQFQKISENAIGIAMYNEIQNLIVPKGLFFFQKSY